MLKPKTHIAIILDRSGSMYSTKDATVVGYNEQVEQIQNDSQDQEILVSLVTFNGNVYEHFWNENADNLVKSSCEEYSPNGSTALYDAIGYTIDKMQKTTTEDENTAYLFIIITDGEENSSKQYFASNIKNKIESLQNDKNWTFTFMGCDQKSAFKIAETTSIPLSNCASWSNKTQAHTYKAMHQNSNKLRKYLSARACGQSVSCTTYHSDDLEVANYDSVDSKDIDNFAKLSIQSVGQPSASKDNGVFSTCNTQVKLDEYYVA